MGVEIPDRLREEVLEIVTAVTPGQQLSNGEVSPPEKIDEAVESAFTMWANRGNPVNDVMDQMLERAVRKAMTGWRPE